MTVGSADGDSGSDPMFAGPIKNVTVNVGREAVLECQVNSLGQYKVAELPLATGGDAGDEVVGAGHCHRALEGGLGPSGMPFALTLLRSVAPSLTRRGIPLASC